MLTKQDVVGMLEDGRLRPVEGSTTYRGMTMEGAAEEYLRRCAKAGVCAGCFNRLDAEDRELSGQNTNVCISCACY